MVVWHACIQYHLNSIVYHLRHCSSHTIQQLIVVCSCVYVLDVLISLFVQLNDNDEILCEL